MDINATLFGQMLTFGVLVWFTMKFVWPNLQATLKARQAKIAEGLAAGKRGEQALQESDKKVALQLQAAHQKAQEIFDRAEQQALEHFLEMKKLAEIEKEKIVQAGHEQIQQAIQQAKLELKNQLANLVVASTEKILARTLSGSDETSFLKTLVQNTDWTVLDPLSEFELMSQRLLERTFARPYARAVFELAKQQNQVDAWFEQLQILKIILLNSGIDQALRANRLAVTDLFEWLKTAPHLNWVLIQSFLTELVRQKRFLLLPEIANAFEKKYYQLKNILPVEVSSVTALSNVNREIILKSLEKSLPQQQIVLTERVIPELLGGFVLRIGHQVLDFSIREQLKQLNFVLKT